MKQLARGAALAAALTIVVAANLSAVHAQDQSQPQAQPQAKPSIWSRFKQEVGSMVAPKGEAATAFPGTHRRIQDTALADIFNSEAAAGTGYPHVAITVTDWSDRITRQGMNPTSQAQANDCLVFDAMLWRNAQSSEPINGLIICAGEARQGYMRGAFDGGFRFASVSGENTGQRRTTGPQSPANVYPRTAEADDLLDGPGQSLLANLLMQLGLDFSVGANVGRVWVVSVSNQPGT